MRKANSKLSPALVARLSNRLGRDVTNPPDLDDLVAALADAQAEAAQCAADVSHGAAELLRLQEDEILTGADHADAIYAAVDNSAAAKARGTAFEVELRVLSKLIDEARERQNGAQRAAQRRQFERTFAEVESIATELDGNLDRVFEGLCRLSAAAVALRSVSPEINSTSFWQRDFLGGIPGRRLDALVSGRRDDSLSNLAPGGVPGFLPVAAALVAAARRDLGYDVANDAGDAQHAQETEAAA